MPYDPASNPFPGLRPFESKEGYLFFGREGQSEELLKRLLQVRLLAVVGTSGSGKSSLVRAGLVPYLNALPGSFWHAATFRPSGNPIGSLASALSSPDVIGKPALSEEDAARDKSLLEARLRRGGLGLIEVVRLARLPEEQNILIVIDQFEELFRFVDSPDHRDDGAAFVKLILEATRQTELPIYIALTMRSDFIGDCSQFHDLPETVAAGLYLIPRMTRDQRRAAIEEPVRIAGGSISRRLTNRVLNDAGDDPDQLPIMQHALMRTWENWKKSEPPSGRPMDLENYLATGGMAEALSKHADEALDDLDDKGKDIACRMFKCLTEKGADNRQVRRATEYATLADVVGVTRPELTVVIETFRGAGRSFLMPPPPIPLNDDTPIDISHESLIRRWNRLAGWVDQEAESAAIYRRLAQTTVLHEQHKAGLWSDPDLADCLVWKEHVRPTEAWAERYGGHFKLAMDFLEQSRAARDAALLHKRRFWQSVVAATAFVIVGLSAITFWALAQKHRAQLQELAANQATADVLQVATLARQQFSDAETAQENGANQILAWAPPAWSAYLHFWKAQSLTDAGNLGAAQTEIDLARRANPDFLPPLVTSSYLFLVSGDADSAAHDAEAFLQVVQTQPFVWANLGLAEAMRRNYGEAISKIDGAIENSHPPFGGVDTFVTPEIQDFTHGFKLSLGDSDFSLALRYTKAFLYAMSGDDRFQAALDEADHSDRDYPYSRNAYLAALNWQWYIVRGQGLHDFESKTPDGGAAAIPQELRDYGGYVVEGALWDRIAQTRSEYHEFALRAYQKFQNAYRNQPQDRYKGIADWVERQLHRMVPVVAPEDPTADQARALAQQAQELKAASGSAPIQFAPAIERLSDAIALLQAKPISNLGRRERDLLIDLLWRRANWRLEGNDKDKGGAADDARSVIALDDKIADAYRLLAAAAFDDASRKANDEHALDLDPYNSAALQDLANVVKTNSPDQALALLQKRQRVVLTWSDDYLQISILQERLGKYPEALRSIASAIEIAPWQIGLYEQRRDIEKAAGADQDRIDLHFAQGLRAMADFQVRTGHDDLGLQAYLRAFMQVSRLQNMNDDAIHELQAVVRNLSSFVSANYQPQDALDLWRTLSQDPLLTSSQQQLATQEANRLSKQQH